MTPDQLGYLGAGVLLGVAAAIGLIAVWRRGRDYQRKRRDRD